MVFQLYFPKKHFPSLRRSLELLAFLITPLIQPSCNPQFLITQDCSPGLRFSSWAPAVSDKARLPSRQPGSTPTTMEIPLFLFSWHIMIIL